MADETGARVGTHIELRGTSGDVYERFAEARRRRLIGVEDDMWAAFADQADHHALWVDGDVVGCCAIDDEGQLLSFHIDAEFDHVASVVLNYLVDDQNVIAAVAATVDPGFLSLALTAGEAAEPVALMYEHPETHRTGSEVDDGLEVRRATPDDHAGAVAFCEESTGSGGTFFERYLADRIALGELYLVEDTGGWITATGECRTDGHSAAHAHLGLIVGAELRNQGLGSRLMRAMTDTARDGGLLPLCSTEPSNLAAQQVIRRAGFRSRHRVFRIPLATSV